MTKFVNRSKSIACFLLLACAVILTWTSINEWKNNHLKVCMEREVSRGWGGSVWGLVLFVTELVFQNSDLTKRKIEFIFLLVKSDFWSSDLFLTDKQCLKLIIRHFSIKDDAYQNILGNRFPFNTYVRQFCLNRASKALKNLRKQLVFWQLSPKFCSHVELLR